MLRAKIPGKRVRFTQAQRNLLASKAKGIRFSRLKELANAITTETLLRWIRSKYDSSAKRERGRPTIPKEMRDLAIQLAKENSTWGYTKVQGVLKSLGHKSGRTPIRELLVGSGIVPAPDRRKGKKWEDFLRENQSGISAVDFLTVEILTLTGFLRYLVMIVMRLATRRVTLAGIYLEPNGLWVEQVGRGLVGGFGECWQG